MKDTQVTSIRIPTDLFDTLRRTAKRERRSINAQIVLYVENQMRAEGKFPESEDFPNQEIEGE